jgi:predicted AAA+ superfamily ATPase
MYVERSISPLFQKIAESVKVIALVGPRQSGKTTFLKHHSAEFNAKYVTFDDPDVRERFSDIKQFELEYVNGNNVTILDEVQYGTDPGVKLKYLADRGHRLWITSSTEMLLGASVLSHLVGRISIQRLYPFDLEEIGRAKEVKSLTDTIEKRVITEQMRYGGFPGIILQNDPDVRISMLRGLLETLLLKDVANTFSITDLDSLQKMSKILALNVGAPITTDKLCRDLNLSFPTVRKYIDALTKSHLIMKIPPFFTNRNVEMKKQPRYYFLDMGLRNAVINDFSNSMEGRGFENYVISELVKEGFDPRFWRTKGGAEVDVILELGREVVPIEIKTKIGKTAIGRGFRSFIERYSPKRGFLVGYEVDKDQIKEQGCRIKTVTLRGLLKEIKTRN